MKLRTFLTNLMETLAGTGLKKPLRRNADAADQLDRAVREMLRK